MADPVAFLTAALARAEQLAHGTAAAVERTDCDGTHEWRMAGMALRHFLAACGPAAVLRLVVGARQILAEHANDGCGDCTVCARESEECNGVGAHYHEPLPWPCRTVLLLAQAWGWEDGQDG